MDTASVKNFRNPRFCQYCNELLDKSFILKCNHVFCKDCIEKLAEINATEIANTKECHGIICSVDNCNHFSSTGDIVTKVDEERLVTCYDKILNLELPKVKDFCEAIDLSMKSEGSEIDKLVPIWHSFANSEPAITRKCSYDNIEDSKDTISEVIVASDTANDNEFVDCESGTTDQNDSSIDANSAGTANDEEMAEYSGSSCEYISIDCIQSGSLYDKLSQLLTYQHSYRSTDIKLSTLPTNNTVRKSGFQLQKYCEKICYIDDKLWCACPKNNCIDVYTLQGDLVRSIILDAVEKPRAIHPYNSENILVAARSGLYTVNKKSGGLISKNLVGTFRDVHGCGNTIVALQKVKSKPFTEFHIRIFQPTIPLTKCGFISVGNDALSVLVTDQHILFSSGYLFGSSHNIAKYTLKGYYVAKSGRKALLTDAEVGTLKWPYICVSDTSGSVLVADHGHNRLQIFSGENCWAVVKGVNVTNPRDAIIVNKQIIVNSNYNSIEIYEM